MNKLIQLIAIENNLQLPNWCQSNGEITYTNGLREFRLDIQGNNLEISVWDMTCHCYLDAQEFSLSDPQLMLKVRDYINTPRKPLSEPSFYIHDYCPCSWSPCDGTQGNAKEEPTWTWTLNIE